MMKSNILNKVSKLILIIALLIFIAIQIPKYIKEDIKYNFIELQMRFKHYTLVDKYEENDKYIFILVNPITEKKEKVSVTQAMYTNVYFVGDMIK